MDTIGPGHNQPPDDVELLLQRAADLTKNADAWGTIADADQAARLGDFLKQLRESRGDLESAEVKAKAPLMAAIATIRERFRRPLDGLDLSIKRCRLLSGDWLARERDRLIDEQEQATRAAEQARRIAEAQQAEALRTGRVEDQMTAAIATDEAVILADQAAKATTRPVIRGDLSGKAVSMRTTWKAEIIDPIKARRHFARHVFVLSAIDAAIVSIASKLATIEKDETKAPPGIRFVKKETAQ
jgi:hypothetical protein